MSQIVVRYAHFTTIFSAPLSPVMQASNVRRNMQLLKWFERMFSGRYKALYEYRKSNPIELPLVEDHILKAILEGKDQGYFQLVMYNDDTTPMEFVIEVLEYYLGYTIKDAVCRMVQIHKAGCCGIYLSNEELANLACSFITNASQDKGYPLKCCVQRI